MSLLSILFDVFREAFKKTIFWSQEHRETPRPSTGAAEPSEETAEPGADTAKPRSRTAEPKPTHGDSTFSSEPGASPPGTFYGDSAALSEPGAKDRKPSTETTKPSADSVKPNRDSRARGGSKNAPGAVLGFDVSTRKPRKVILNTGGAISELRSPSYLADFGQKMVFKSDFLVPASRKWV